MMTQRYLGFELGIARIPIINLLGFGELRVMFQKQSPYLDDMNWIIDSAKDMGLIEMIFYKHLPNATKCDTSHEVFQSHGYSNQVILELNDIHGMLILLGLGLSGALICFIAEIFHFRM